MYTLLYFCLLASFPFIIFLLLSKINTTKKDTKGHLYDRVRPRWRLSTQRHFLNVAARPPSSDKCFEPLSRSRVRSLAILHFEITCSMAATHDRIDASSFACSLTPNGRRLVTKSNVRSHVGLFPVGIFIHRDGGAHDYLRICVDVYASLGRPIRFALEPR